MSSSFNIIVVLGLLGCSLAVPIDQPTPYDPQDFFPSGRIVGGSDAPDNFARYMVALLAGDIVAMFMCGGSLIAPDKVLTAAHCIEALWNYFAAPGSPPDSVPLLESARAVFGTNEWADERRTAQFSGYKNHPEYDRWNIKFDVGLLTLTQPLKMDDRVALIPMNSKWVGGGGKGFVTGWGTNTTWGMTPDKLQILYVNILSPQQCKEGLKKAEAEMGTIPPLDSLVEICTLRSAGKGMCHGDSGSALVDHLFRQIGIVSWGMPCARGHPDMFGRISSFTKFIKSEM